MAADHFYTILPNERDIAAARYGYQSEGIAGYVFGIQVPGSIPLYRLVSAVNGEHFYTTAVEERNHAIAAVGYQDEGIACFVCPPATEIDPILVRPDGGAVGSGRVTDADRLTLSPITPATALAPLYRLYSPASGDHFYTMSEIERDNAIANVGYQSEGIACALFATPQPNAIPLYRLCQTTSNIPIPQRIYGFADLHNHQFANLAFGGKAFVGAAFGPMPEVLPHCDFAPDHTLFSPITRIGSIVLFKVV